MLVHVENGRLVKIEIDRSYPLWDTISPPTSACPRHLAAKEIQYHPERVNFPLKRAGERGEGKWKTISWEQAFDEIAEKLGGIREEYGAEAVGAYVGDARFPNWPYARFMYLFGSPNIVGMLNICHGPTRCVDGAMLGWPPRHRTYVVVEKDAEGKPATNCILLIGIDPSHSRFRMWKSIRDAVELGTKLIVIDPRRTDTAALADIWLQIRPGTDAALLMSMINVIIEEGLYDREFVEKWCHGFAQLRERAKEYPPEKVAEITWVPAEKIREAARVYGQNPPTMAVNGMGLEQQSNTIAGLQAKFSLSALTGSIDVEGGEYMGGPPRCVMDAEMELSEKLSPEQKRKTLGNDRFRLLGWPGRDAILPHVMKVWGRPYSAANYTARGHSPTLIRAILTGKPYPVKAVLSVGSNFLLNEPNAKLIYKALKSVELHVAMDPWLTPTAELADYVLPIALWLERPLFVTWWGTDNSILAGERALPSAIPGEYDHRTEYDIFSELGRRLGQEEYWPWKTNEEVWDYMLKPLGLTLKEFIDKGGYEFPPKEFKKYEKIGFGTPTGKVELYSTIFEQLGYDPLPYYQEPHESPISKPELAKEFPLILTTGGRPREYYHSEYRQIDSIRRRYPYPLVQINPQTAKKLGIADGDWVWIESPRGRIRQKAKLFGGIDPRIVHADYCWWYPELPGEEPWLHGAWESNVNVLVNDDPDVCDKLAGGWPLKALLCKVYKCKVY